jgi:glyoxylate reductase
VARCFVTRELPGGALDRLRGEHDVGVWQGELPPSRDELIEHASDAEGLLCLLTDVIDAEVIAACPELRAISNYAVGSDNIDREAAAARGIEVGVTPDVLTDTTAELAFALMLAAARRLFEAERAVRAGEWRTWELTAWLGQDLGGATLCIVGMGRIGSAVARKAEAFGMKVVGVGRNESLTDALAEADFVSIHCPLTDETRGLIGEAELEAMKPTAVLVNTARGPIVRTDALLRALQERRIGGAALDVTDPEPLPSDHPLLSVPNALVVPHIGSATHRTRERMADLAVENLLSALSR